MPSRKFLTKERIELNLPTRPKVSTQY
jgi:hypothetical protein